MTTEPQPYRKKPVEVEAIQLTDDTDWPRVAAWCGGRTVAAIDGKMRLIVPTLHGPVFAIAGQWLVRGPRDHWPVDAETFAETYEAVDNA